jgi:hypothetical protein
MRMETNIELTPEQLAAVFCGYDSQQMAAFFTECKRLSQGPDWAAGGIYAQALWLRAEMKPGTPGGGFLMDLAAPWYTHTLMYIDTHGERERA